MFKIVLLLTIFTIASSEKLDGYNYNRPTIAFLLPRQQLVLPRQQQLPEIYGPPQSFSSPQSEYGPPLPTELTPPEVDLEPREESEDVLTTTEMPTTTEEVPKEAEEIKESKDVEEIEGDVENKEVEDAKNEEGVYYIYHPSGLLQRIIYTTNNDVRNMAYTAQFRYKDVEPIRDPVYTYDPETLVLRQIVA
ncbi:uncharacterized protein [Onthophagus taurus]|uniref:uncharacterized protein n=1 Tax=Onthophagus taurus TaxID=166361 RepID=UPI000C2039E6|nr:uncharacterized protein LOC111417756 [Onthophagus taurus]